jgi:hypothetical protein
VVLLIPTNDGIVPQLVKERFLPNPFQFIIHQSPSAIPRHVLWIQTKPYENKVSAVPNFHAMKMYVAPDLTTCGLSVRVQFLIAESCALEKFPETRASNSEEDF